MLALFCSSFFFVFLEKHWSVLDSKVLVSIKDFHSSCSSKKSLNATFTVLIPKKGKGQGSKGLYTYLPHWKNKGRENTSWSSICQEKELLQFVYMALSKKEKRTSPISYCGSEEDLFGWIFCRQTLWKSLYGIS